MPNICSLYTKILHSEVIQAISELLVDYMSPTQLPHNSNLIDLWKGVLESNYFEFDGKYYHQVADTAMGTNLVPSYTNIFMSNFESKYAYFYPKQHLLWKRFIDFFLIWGPMPIKLSSFITNLNPTIKSLLRCNIMK